MENVIDLIATDASPAEISDAIKGMLYTKAAERIEGAKPIVADMMFNDEIEQEEEQEE
jgi:hypothetical protein